MTAADEMDWALEEDDYGNVSFCPACNAENEPMGILGRRTHYRCRACGMMWSAGPDADQQNGDNP